MPLDGRMGDEGTECVRVRVAAIHRLAHDVFSQVGLDADDARELADYFAWVELHGRPFLGARRIPEFLARIREGGTKLPVGAGAVTVHDTAGIAVLDGRDTFAQIAGVRGMDLAIEKAAQGGVGVVVVRNVTTAGALGYYALRAVNSRMIGMAINNTPPVMSAWGGTNGVMGPQPFAVASPAGRHDPVLLDMTNSTMSMARMYEFQRRRESLPEGIGFTAEGVPTTDPASAIAGVLQPMAGHRGYGLALMWEVLTGVLAGGQHFGNTVGWPAEHGRPMGVSMFLMAIDPTVAMPFQVFTSRVDRVIDQVKASQLASGFERVTVPGERSVETARRMQADGVPLPAAVARALDELAREVGVAGFP